MDEWLIPKAIIVGGILIFCLLLFNLIGGLGYNSEGIREGKIFKFSERGWIWKTWEGEIGMGAFIEANPYVFEFSVCDKNPEKIRVLQNAVGKTVKLHYFSPIIFFKWNQGSAYCVKKIEVK